MRTFRQLIGETKLISHELGQPLTWKETGTAFTQADNLNNKMQALIKASTSSVFINDIYKRRECFRSIQDYMQILQDGKGYNITYQIAMLFGSEPRRQA